MRNVFQGRRDYFQDEILDNYRILLNFITSFITDKLPHGEYERNDALPTSLLSLKFCCTYVFKWCFEYASFKNISHL